MKKILAFLLIPVLAGCLTSSMPDVSRWMLEYRGAAAPAKDVRFEAVRVSQIVVCPPYNSINMAVLRANGTVAFDAYNEFAAQPALLLKGPIYDALTGSGLFRTVVGPSSSVQTSVAAEVLVTRFALDCRTEGRRLATVAVLLRILDRREPAVIVKGDAAVDAADGNYGAAFSRAVSQAFESALGQVR